MLWKRPDDFVRSLDGLFFRGTNERTNERFGVVLSVLHIERIGTCHRPIQTALDDVQYLLFVRVLELVRFFCHPRDTRYVQCVC